MNSNLCSHTETLLSSSAGKNSTLSSIIQLTEQWAQQPFYPLRFIFDHLNLITPILKKDIQLFWHDNILIYWKNTALSFEGPMVLNATVEQAKNKMAAEGM